MKHLPIFVTTVAVGLTGCVSSVDLTAIRSETCKSAAAYPNAIARMSSAAPAPLKYVPPLATTFASGALPPPITKKNIADGSALLNTPGAAVLVPQLVGAPAAGNPPFAAAGLLPNSDHYLIGSESEVSDEDVQYAKDARDQIRELLSATPLSANNFISNGNNLHASLGTVSKSNASSIGKINKTLKAGGYESLTNASVDQLNKADGLSLSDAQKNYLTQEVHTARFLATYYKAYFRGGHILQISVDTKSLVNAGAQSVDSKIDKAVSDATGVKNLTDEQKTAVSNVITQLKGDLGNEFTKLSADICKGDPTAANDVCLLTQPLGNISFVSRAGTTIQFSGETITVGGNGKLTPSTTKISMSVVGPQLSQVLWEAIFDSVPPFVPATANSTACVSKLYQGNLCIAKDTPKATLDQIDSVDADATSAETTTATVTGYLIRGGWFFSLNNEAVAQVVETSAGEIARKTTEKLVWTHLNSACSNQPTHPTVSTVKDL